MTRLSLLALLALTASCSTGAPAHAPPERTPPKPAQEGLLQIAEGSRAFVTTTVVSPESSGALLQAPARVAFRDEAIARVAAPFAGRVVTVHVRTGDAVKPGDALVTLDCPDAASARTAVLTATAALREAQLAVERERRMQEQGVGIERERLAAETRLAEAQAELSRAHSASSFVGGGTGSTLVLRAPIAGTVLSRNATVGAALQPGGEPLVEVGDPSALWVVAEVFERDLPLVREGARVQVELPSERGPLSGQVISVGTVVTAGSRTAPVRIHLDTSGAGMRPGMFGRVRIEATDAGITLPSQAVLIRNGKQLVVYVQQDSLTFERRTVAVAQSVEGRVRVISGLSPGEKVVTQGALLLDGAADQLL